MEDAAAGDVGVAFGGAEVGVTEEGLDVTDVGTAFEEVGGKGVAQAVDRGFFADFCAREGSVKNILGGADRKVAGRGKAGKEPALYTIKRTIFTDKTSGFF